MSQIITADGKMIPITYVICEPNTVLQKKTMEKDGYEAVVLGTEPLKKPTKTKKFKSLREFSFSEEVKLNDQITVEIFALNDLVTVRGVSKGKGFQGRVRRHGMHPTRKTHGTKYIRHGSTGMRAMPGRVKKGTRMPGRMGADNVTLHKKAIVLVDSARNLLAIKGPVPGAVNSLVIIEK